MSHTNYSRTGQLMHDEQSTLYLQTYGDDHSDVNFEFVQPLQLRNEQFKIALTKIKIWLTMQNINANIGNNTLTFYVNNISHTVTFPDGNYTLSQINSIISKSLIASNLNPNLLQFEGESSNGLITMIIQPTVKIDIATDSPQFAELLGFSAYPLFDNTTGLVPFILFDGVSLGATEPKLNYYYNPVTGQTVPINSIHVHCDSVDGRVYSNSESNQRIGRSSHATLYKFTPTQQPNTLLVDEPYNFDFVHMRSIESMTTMRMYLTNENDIPLNGMITKPILYSLKMRSK